jgi:hypothetical protein
MACADIDALLHGRSAHVQPSNHRSFVWRLLSLQWRLLGDYIDSGNNRGLHYLESVFQMQLGFLRTTVLSFEYKVEAERYFDFFYLILDNVIRLSKDRSNGWLNYNITIAPGHHTIQFVYYKDRNTEYGEDKASVRNIRFHGISLLSAFALNIECRLLVRRHAVHSMLTRLLQHDARQWLVPSLPCWFL